VDKNNNKASRSAPPIKAGLEALVFGADKMKTVRSTFQATRMDDDFIQVVVDNHFGVSLNDDQARRLCNALDNYHGDCLTADGCGLVMMVSDDPGDGATVNVGDAWFLIADEQVEELSEAIRTAPEWSDESTHDEGGTDD